MSAEAPAAPGEYRWRMPPVWWTRNRRYFFYVVREFTSLPLAIWLLWLLVDISQKHLVAREAFLVFSIVCLLFALYHSITFLSLAGSILHFRLMERPVSSRLIVVSQFGLWAAATVAVGFLLIWLSR